MTISKLRFLIIGFLFICINLNAQTPAIEWHKCLGSNFSDYADCIQPTSDGGFIVAGTSVGDDNGDVMGHHANYTVGDIWIVKLDPTGKIEWQKSLGGSDSEEGVSILQTPDGGYIVAGATASIGCEITVRGTFDFWVVKLNSKGDIIWQKTYGGSQTDIAYSVALSNDGGYYVAGWTDSNDFDVKGNHGIFDYWVIKIDAVGNLIWQKCLGGDREEYASSIQATADGGCIISGSASSDNGDVTGVQGNSDIWVVKLDHSGKIQWQKTLGGSMLDMSNCIQVAKDGGYILAGHTYSTDGDVTGSLGGYDAWIVKLDNVGKIIWEKSYGGSTLDYTKYIQNTPDGGYVFTGGTVSSDGDFTCHNGHYDAFVIKINNTGKLEWQKTLGGSDFDEGQCVQALNDGSYIVVGYTGSPDIAGYHTPFSGTIYDDKFDYWVIKLSAPMANEPAPIVKIDAASTILCSGKQVTLTASVVYGGVKPVYQWKRNGIPVGTNSPSYTDGNFNDNDQVSCIVSKGNICEDIGLQGSDVVNIKLKNNAPIPEINISTDNLYACNCATITIKTTVTNGGGSPHYQWKVNGKNAGNNPSFISTKIKEGDVITCTYTDNLTCTPNGSVVSNALTFAGENGTPPAITVTASADTICNGSVVTFTAKISNAGVNPIYQWKVNNSNVGTNSPVFSSSSLPDGAVVSCTIKTDPLFTCAAGPGANSNNVVVRVINKLAPAVQIAASATTICIGMPVTFTATATSAGINPGYQWKINGVNTGTNNKVFHSSSLSNKDTVSCIITIDPNFTCALANQAVSQNIIMTISAGTPPSVEITADKNNVCAGENITLTAVADNAGTNPGFEWISNGVLLPINSPVYTSDKFKNGDQLFCRIIPGAGACSTVPDSSNVFVAVINNVPVVKVSPADTSILSGTQVNMSSSVSGNMVSFQWNPADQLINPSSLNPQTKILNENTTYTLSVVDDKGCKASATAVIKIGTSLYMPNAFTPNDDGVNDLFRIPPNVIMELKEFSIYDRWGKRIFTTTNKNLGWDGTMNGKKQNTATYVYVLKCRIDGKDVFLKGRFTLIN